MIPHSYSAITTLALVLLLNTACLTSTGCASKTATAQDTTPTQEPVITASDAAKIGYRIAWIKSLGIPQDQKIAWAKPLDDILLIAESPSNIITAVNMRDGSIEWRQALQAKGESIYEPFHIDDKLFMNSGTVVFVLDRFTGNIKRKFQLDHVVQSPPTLTRNKLVFGALNGRVYAIGVGSGFTAWSYLLTAPIQVQPVSVIDDIFATDQNGVYAMFSDLDGSLLWRGRTFGQASAPPAANRETIFLASEDRKLYALNARSGRDIWIHPTTTPLTESPVVLDPADGVVYLPIPNNGIAALDALTGKLRWQAPILGRPVAKTKTAILVLSNRNLILIDAENGKLIRKLQTPNLETVIAHSDGNKNSLLVIQPDGKILRLLPN